jgi:glutamine synthetase
MNEGSKFLSDNPDITAIDAILPDVSGVIRGKRIAPATLSKIFDNGFQIPASTAMLDVTGDDLDPTGLSAIAGDPDVTAWPVSGTLASVPWAKNSIAQVLVSLFELDGTPYRLDPRHVLSRVISRFDDMGLKPVVALEQEFYLLDKEGAREGAPRPPIMPGTGRRASGTQVLSISDLDSFGDFLDDVAASCAAQNIPVGPISSEYATGQYEINLIHTGDLLAAADQATLLPRIVKGVAASHGLDATFMAKPYIDQSGNGLHIHASVYDENGVNIFSGGDDSGSPSLHHAIGGLLATMPESMAIFAPNVNSYRRFIPNTYVPTNRTWGVNNRSVAIRIPGGEDANRRLEHRISGADANPYLALAALLAGLHHGLTNTVEPCERSTGNACMDPDPGLPLKWDTALDCLENGTILKEYLGEDYCKTYVSAKRTERETFFSTPSAKEYEWYLRPDC